jgi:membrane protease subunit (stomatin/prohibitin family)
VANAIPLAAQNEGGMAGIGAGLGAGVSVGQVMGQAHGWRDCAGSSCAATAAAEDSIEARLEKLKGLLDKGLISAADYDSAKPNC